ncbi:hypothetical protein [Achromobacter xylosoxidans]|uniref:hypothetical protein n=1 Tax=Alcaligenes xylosoxydans xylosoxydans TaxID=85698 RepID=UPI0005D82764|nr:hypothetical protein [Achromobacter xylosoxidans]QKQ52625.1 hypothetical protein FOC83_06445 [Achromobacter xylosoxidans]QPR92492.1 hypothetical protein I6G72_17585 [Achromobacter xylosoxidans]UON42171.1 hypothetical protein IUJ48_08700 [Achromobacter xylosoxidans]CKH75305.1 Uncharacterised protein [Achromobacter xylosoxidans]SQG75706.1 Uncharacterised protein [Achromobacter xylosoxidans]
MKPLIPKSPRRTLKAEPIVSKTVDTASVKKVNGRSVGQRPSDQADEALAARVRASYQRAVSSSSVAPASGGGWVIKSSASTGVIRVNPDQLKEAAKRALSGLYYTTKKKK